jgi:hypothetical protein
MPIQSIGRSTLPPMPISQFFFIRIFFAKIDPAGRTGTHGDTDDTAANPSKKPIQKCKPGEFEQYARNLTGSAQRFWDGQFWLKTPKTYDGLNYLAHGRPAYRCNVPVSMPLAPPCINS